MKTHRFDNGQRVFDHHLTHIQRERYQARNVHEAIEEDVFLETLAGIGEAGCLVNIGSAIGYYCLLAKMLKPAMEVHAFEPLPRHRRCLRENARLNGFRPSDFSIHALAVSSCPGWELLRDLDYGSVLDEGLRGNLCGGLMRRLAARWPRAVSRQAEEGFFSCGPPRSKGSSPDWADRWTCS